MSRGRRPAVTVPAVLLLLVTTAAVGILLVSLRRTAPHRPLDFVLPASSDPRNPDTDVLTCERTIPEESPKKELGPIQPVGRITSAAVVECPDLFDGVPVTYAGEVIGDVLHRSGGAWLQVNDDAYALEVGPLPSHTDMRGANTGLSVWVPDQLLPPLTPGGPHERGDIVAIRGVVHRVDPTDGGGLTLRASRLEVIVPAQEVAHPLHTYQAIVAAVLALMAAGAGVAQRRYIQRR